jgi:predicted transcriptional regulator
MQNLTQVELEILKILSKVGDCRAGEVHEYLRKVRPIGYTYTLKYMKNMVQKGVLDRHMEGRARIYSPTIHVSPAMLDKVKCWSN